MPWQKKIEAIYASAKIYRKTNMTASSSRKNGKTLILFDVDGTLAVPAQPAKPAIVEMLAELQRTTPSVLSELAISRSNSGSWVGMICARSWILCFRRMESTHSVTPKENYWRGVGVEITNEL